MAPLVIMLMALFAVTSADLPYDNQQQHLFTPHNPPFATTRRDNVYTSWPTTRVPVYQSPARPNTTLSVEKKNQTSGVAKGKVHKMLSLLMMAFSLCYTLTVVRMLVDEDENRGYLVKPH